MIENIYEQSIVSPDNGKTQVKYFSFGALSIIFFMLAVMGVFGFSGKDGINWLSLLFIVGGILLGIYFWRKKDEAYLEYEYAYTCGDLEIAKIINAKRRKTLCKFECSTIEVFGKTTASNYNRYRAMPNCKKLYATFDKKPNDNIYYAFYNGKRGKVLLHFEPDEELLKYIKKHLKVQIDIK